MAALICDICGGKLIGKPGGIFECDSCGVEYSTEWAKAKIQEIKGTVKVEGTVEVTGKVQIEGGTVKVEGGTSVENFVKRGNMALMDAKWDEAKDFFEQALNIDAECAEAYLGKLMAEMRVNEQETLASCPQPFDDRANYQKAFRFADKSLRETLTRCSTSARENSWDRIYAQALEKKDTDTEEGLKEAVELFESIPEWKDSAGQKKDCVERIELRREERLKHTAELVRQRAEQNRLREMRRAELSAAHVAKLTAEKEALKNELEKAKGLFAAKRREEILVRLVRIDMELKKEGQR